MKKPDVSGPGCSLPKLAYTRGEAAQVLGVSAVTIDRLTTRGQPGRSINPR